MKLRIPLLEDIALYILVISVFCFDGDAKLNKILYLAIILFVLTMSKRLMSRPVPSYFWKSWMPFLIVCAASVIWSVNRGVSIHRVVTVAINIVLFGILWVYIVENHKQWELLKSIAIGGMIFAVYIVLYYGGVSSFINMMAAADVRSRIGGEVAHISLIGQSLAMAGIATVALLQNAEKMRERCFWCGALIVELLVILASQSRTGLALLIVGAAALFMIQAKNERIQKWLISAIVLLSIAFVVLQNVDLSSVLGRWSTLFGDDKDASTSIRMRLILEGLSLFLNRPFGGFGIATSEVVSVYKSYFHNNYIELLATTGLLGFASFYYVYANAFRSIKRKAKTNRLASVAMVVLLAQLGIMIATVTYYVKYQFLFVVFIMAVPYTDNQTIEEEIEQ